MPESVNTVLDSHITNLAPSRWPTWLHGAECSRWGHWFYQCLSERRRPGNRFGEHRRLPSNARRAPDFNGYGLSAHGAAIETIIENI